ncbi:MAG: hydrogenase nickel incorporation protein HypA [Candidatus Methanomethylicia archaeon]|nr:hydrogenase nickel incorporation protein HypA [Candidatus Methanomethylicia archaeon]
MHEWALAEAVINTTIKFVEENNLKELKEVIIKIGELQQVDIEIFKFALFELKVEKGLGNVEFKIELVEAKMKCLRCGFNWKFNGEELKEDVKEAIHFIPEVVHAFMRCPICKSPDFELTEGRGIWIDSIIGVK